MGNINDILRQIETEPKGKEMRRLFKEAIQECYNAAARSGNVNMEIQEARGGETTLGRRIDNLRDGLARFMQGLVLVLKKEDVINHLTSDESSKVLAAAQGKVLDEKINALGVEYGTNSNGEYWKFRDGRLLTRKVYKNQSHAITEVLNGITYKWILSHNYPLQFIETPSVTITLNKTSGTGIYTGLTDIANTRSAAVVITSPGANTFNGEIVIQAEGRWK